MTIKDSVARPMEIVALRPRLGSSAVQDRNHPSQGFDLYLSGHADTAAPGKLDIDQALIGTRNRCRKCQRRQGHRHENRRRLAPAPLANNTCLAPPAEHQAGSHPVLTGICLCRAHDAGSYSALSGAGDKLPDTGRRLRAGLCRVGHAGRSELLHPE